MKGKVVVIGGGIVGCSIAYLLGKKGYNVTLLEKNEIAYGASGRNPGYLLIHNRQTGTALELAKLGINMLSQFNEELGDCFEFRNNGCITYFYTENQKEVAIEFVEKRKDDGIEIELLDRDEAKRLAPILPDDILGAMFSKLDGQMNTKLLVNNLAKVAQEKYHVEIQTGVEVMKLIINNNEINGVKTTNGDYFGDYVIICTGPYSPLLQEKTGIELPVYQERLQVLQTEPVDVKLDQIVYGPSAMKHYSIIQECPSYKEEYFLIPEEKKYGLDMIELICQRDDGSLIVGCPFDYPGLTSENPTLNGIQQIIENFNNNFKHLNVTNVRRVWAGWLPFTTDGLPIIGNVEDINGLYVAVGHIFGNTAGPASAKLLVEMIEGDELSVNIDECRYGRVFPSYEDSNW